ncbi:glutathione S-transferase family protein [Ramlibacter sp.]|uniref:glutathione S-transferase family protein n=1 Tax=Ramlibacter sp. TaxID=1917967 RepID=UPI0017DF659C|nr:glutathione S-transferase family protein [Ramlibacter sp.]MBA2672205.1 glutathione S-transferase family protein [Ramlibacter sp.]
MLRIWGRITSLNVRKVVFTAQLLGIPFEQVDAGLAYGVVQTPEYKAKNPNSLVPLLEDEDGFTLWESNVIVRYLCARHGAGGLYPQALRERFDAERWMDWQQATLNPAGRNAFIQLVRTPAERRDAAALAQSQAETGPLLDMLDAQLARQSFLAAGHLTMADIPVAADVHRWLGLPLQHAGRPHLARWFETIRGLPAARGVFDVPLS